MTTNISWTADTLAIALIAAGLHVEVKHKAFYPIAVGAFGTD